MKKINKLTKSIQRKLLTQYLPIKITSLNNKDGSSQLVSILLNQAKSINSPPLGQALIKAIETDNTELAKAILISQRKIDSWKLGEALTKAIAASNKELAKAILNSLREIDSQELVQALIKAIKLKKNKEIKFTLEIITKISCNLIKNKGYLHFIKFLIKFIKTMIKELFLK